MEGNFSDVKRLFYKPGSFHFLTLANLYLKNCSLLPFKCIRGGVIIKNRKIWDNVPNRLDPPPLSDIWDFFEFETYLKNADPPSRINLRHFWIWEHIDGGRTPRINILKGLFRHIYIEKGQIKCFNFSFLGWDLRVTYHSDIFEKLGPSNGVSNVQIWISDIFVCFLSPPPIWDIVPNFPVF